MTTYVVAGNQEVQGAVAAGLVVSADLPFFASSSVYCSIVGGDVQNGDPFGGDSGNGGIILGARRNATTDPPTNAPFSVVGWYDYGGGGNIREVDIGGGNYDAPDATAILFYAGPYTETPNQGLLRFGIDGPSGTCAFLGDGPQGADPNGALLQIVYNQNGRALDQTDATAENGFAGTTTFAAGLRETGVISPTAFSGTVNDYAPTGLATARRVRLDLTGDVALTGIEAQPPGTLLTLHHVGTNPAYELTLKADDAGSAAANRFRLSNGTDRIISTNGSATLWYDGDSACWRLESVT